MSVDYDMLFPLLAGIAGGADDPLEIEAYTEVDLNRHDDQLKIIRDVLFPAFRQIPGPLRVRVLSELRSALLVENVNWSGIFPASLAPMPPPSDARRFFERIYDLFTTLDNEWPDEPRGTAEAQGAGV